MVQNQSEALTEMGAIGLFGWVFFLSPSMLIRSAKGLFGDFPPYLP